MSVLGVQKEFLDVNTPKMSISASAGVTWITVHMSLYKLCFVPSSELCH